MIASNLVTTSLRENAHIKDFCLGREKYVKYHKALLDCLYCGQFINRWPSQNLGNGWSGNKGESGEVLILAD
jgi:hypothetical protein